MEFEKKSVDFNLDYKVYLDCFFNHGQMLTLFKQATLGLKGSYIMKRMWALLTLNFEMALYPWYSEKITNCSGLQYGLFPKYS